MCKFRESLTTAKKALIPVAVALIFVFFSTTNAAADYATCPPNLGAVTVGDLIVVADSICFLTKTTVEGDIRVESDATLVARGIIVEGSLFANRAKLVFVSHGPSDPLDPSVVYGDIEALKSNSVQVILSAVSGDVTLLKGGTGLSNNVSIGGDLIFVDNEFAQASGNDVAGDLRCERNREVFLGLPNIVGGDKVGQCADF